MTEKQGAIIAILSGILLLLFVITIMLIWNPPKVQKWTYTIDSFPDAGVASELNNLGDQGCIVDSARRATSGTGSDITASYEFIIRCPA